ncbi:MAG: hypothetical protein WD278_07960 [Pirellulales bacterium]
MKLGLSCTLVVLLAWSSRSVAAEHRVERLESPPPEGIAPAIAEQLASTGFKVLRGENRTVCEIWPAKQWPVKADFSPSGTVLYPFEMGQLMGAIRYPRKGEDFRGQEIASGVYILRYAQQPVDGNHVGTSDTRDFLLLLPAEHDTSPAPVAKDELFELSAKAAGTTHPAMLSLLAAGEGESLPAMTHNMARDLWSLRFANQTDAEGQESKLVIELVVVGTAPE